MRHVFPTSEVPHLWAHQSQSDARNPQGNLFFEGATIYSYRRSWPLARIYTNRPLRKDGTAESAGLVLTNANRCSNTTAKHQNMVNRACSHLPAIAVPYVEPYALNAPNHEQNIKHFRDKIARLLAESQRAMMARNVEWRNERALAHHAEWRQYHAFFGIRRKVPDFPGVEFAAASDRATRIETPDPVRDAKKIKAREQKAAAFERKLVEYREKLAAHVDAAGALERWRAGGAFHTDKPEWWEVCPAPIRRALTNTRRGHWYWGTAYVTETLLRVSGDQIETSHGARIPVEHAPRIWRLVQACRASGRAYERNGHTEHAGPYAIDRIEADGTLKAGCHTISFDEIALLAVTLGIANG